MRMCRKCNQSKTDDQFYTTHSYCKTCKIQQSREKYAPRKMRVRLSRIRSYINGLKICKHCLVSRPIDEYNTHPSHWDKRSHVCKVCEAKQEQARYIASFNRRNLLQKEWYRKNRTKKLEQGRLWRLKNRDASHAIWHRYRSRKSLSGTSFTSDEWRTIKAFYAPDDRCIACGSLSVLHKDHVIPVSKGGENNISNIQPLCKSCNSQKGSKYIDYRSDGGTFARSLLGGIND